MGNESCQPGEVEEEMDSSQRSTAGAVRSDEKEGFGQSGEQVSSSSSSSLSSTPAITSSSSSSDAKSESQPSGTEARGSSTAAASELEPKTGDQGVSSGGSEAGARLVQADVHASLENGEKGPPSSSPFSEEEKGADSERRGEEEEEEEDEENDNESRKDDYSEGDLVDISAYSGLGEEDSGGSQLEDEEEEDEEAYQPETSCSEIAGLPEEEEPAPASRKIRFSTQPIKVSVLFDGLGPELRVCPFISKFMFMDQGSGLGL